MGDLRWERREGGKTPSINTGKQEKLAVLKKKHKHEKKSGYKRKVFINE